MRLLHRVPPTTDTFLKHVLIVFFGTALANVCNLAYQLLIAHRLSAGDFAAFNALLSVLVIASTPLLALQTTLARYISSYNARSETAAVHSLFASFMKGGLYLTALLLLCGVVLVPFLLRALKIESGASGALLVVLIGISCLNPITLGMLQGLERFSWLTSVGIIAGCVKLLLVFVFIEAGYRVAGALGALVLSLACTLLISLYPLRGMIAARTPRVALPLGAILRYCIPIAVGTFCLQMLTNIDMLFVRRYLAIEASGVYAVAQMAGKVFLFLPGAISIVMFPKTSGLKARKEDTRRVLTRSLLIAGSLCVAAAVFYNLWPSLVLTLLTGKGSAESIFLGRFFSVSMTFAALLLILINYFLSVADLRFMPFLIGGILLEVVAFVFVGRSGAGVVAVQVAVSSVAGLLLAACLFLAFVPKR